jgi:DNA-directed RNA polymerase subunit E'/Rpb7
MSKKYSRINNLYNRTIITKKIIIPMRNITTIINKTEDLNQYMEEVIEKEISDKCIVEGYIKPNSIIILSYSNGIQENQNIKFQVVFECLVCNPSEGQIINCVAKNITKAGIRAEIEDEFSPLIIFIARDHNYLNKLFSTIKPEQQITIRIIGSRFELNDLKISVVGEIVRASKLAKLSVGQVIDNEVYEEIDPNNDDLDEVDYLDELDDDVASLEDEVDDLKDDVADDEEDAEEEADEEPDAEDEEPDAQEDAEEDAQEDAEEDAEEEEEPVAEEDAEEEEEPVADKSLVK